MFLVKALCLLSVSLVHAQTNTPSSQNNDPSYGGLFTTARPQPYIHPDEYVQPENKQDQFDWKLTQVVLRDSRNQNVIISPLSVKLLLTLLAEAAGETIGSRTRTELEQVLPYNKSLFDAKEYFKRVLSSLSIKSDDYSVNFGTKIFVDKDVNVNQRFSSIAEHNYLADVEELDFADSTKSVQAINNWVKSATNGHIRDLVSDSSVANSVILLINALYFEGTWRFGFNKTKTGTFNTSSGTKVEKTFLEQTRNFYYFYSKHLDAKILRLPYNGRRYSLFVILPTGNNNVDNVIERLDAGTIKNEVWHMDEVEVHVVLPKFKFDSSINLNDVVKKLGIREIFETSATFPLLARGGTSEGKLKVSNIIQKSGIIVDEKGTTAWSATEVELVNKFGGEPREFIVDRPFLFYIEDDTTGAKLFSGRVNNPEY